MITGKTIFSGCRGDHGAILINIHRGTSEIHIESQEIVLNIMLSRINELQFIYPLNIP